MTQVSVSEAAKLVSKDRKTLYRLIKEGRLSATTGHNGVRQVETSELIRVFGEMRQQSDTGDSGTTVSMPQHETSVATPNIELLQAELRHARELLAVKDSQIEDLRQSMRLLSAPQQKTEAKQSIWTRPIRLWPRSK